MHIKNILQGARGLAWATAIAVAAACSSSAPGTPEGAGGEVDVSEAPSELIVQPFSSFKEILGVPLPGRYLWATSPASSGLIPASYLRADGTPPPGHYSPGSTISSPMDEAEAYYYNADPTHWVPATLTEWKARFGVLARPEGQSVGDYRASTYYGQPLVVYYNQNELGLGRELGCGDWTLENPAGPPSGPRAMGCFVTNYGGVFGDAHNSLFEAILGKNPKNTVAIVYRPSLPTGYQVQFYVFDADGVRQDWAQLDSLGARPHPQICINCHGGSYDSTAHLASGARFLPLDPNTNVFLDTLGKSVEELTHPSSPPPTPPASWANRSAQEEDIRRINQIAMGTITNGPTVVSTQTTAQLTQVQKDALAGLYGGHLDTANQAALSPDHAWVPPGWRGSQADQDIYTKVVKPYCITCHNAVAGWLQPDFQSAAGFRGSGALYNVCQSGEFDMPQAQATMSRLWDTDPSNAITIAGVSYGTPAQALLAVEFSTTPSACTDYATKVSCRSDDTLCGDRHSGTACDTSTQRCVPNTSFTLQSSELAPTGVCRSSAYSSTVGANVRECPKWEECRASSDVPPGYDGNCFVCGRQGQPTCSLGPTTCFFPAVDHGDGVCHACDEGGPCQSEVYRKYSGPYGSNQYSGGAAHYYHFYTLDPNEGSAWYWNDWSGDFIVERLHQVGGTVRVPPHTMPLYRCNIAGAGHLYTTSSTCNGVAGTTNEGPLGAVGAFDSVALSCVLPGTKPLYELRNSLDQDYFYTTSTAEMAQFTGFVDAGLLIRPWRMTAIVGCVW